MVGVPSDRHRLWATFDSAAHLYQQARPGYPAELYDELIRLAGLRPAARLLEIGCATGKATVPLAERGFRITCLELGPRLAATARDNLARFPAVTVTEADFDTWLAPPGEAFDLVFAATAWHWTDPACSVPSPGTSRWPRGSAITSTRASSGCWPAGRMGGSAGTGGPRCTSPGAQTTDPPALGCGSQIRQPQVEIGPLDTAVHHGHLAGNAKSIKDHGTRPRPPPRSA
jgi:SAM-dependent methyltransferase